MTSGRKRRESPTVAKRLQAATAWLRFAQQVIIFLHYLRHGGPLW